MDERNMPGPVFALFLLLAHQHAEWSLAPKANQAAAT
jgi:hypothetical protein